MDRSASSIRGASAFGRTGSALGASVGWAASLTDGQRVSAKRLINAASRVGGAAGVPIPVSLYRVLYGGGLGAVASGPSSSAAASSVLTVPVTLDALLERLCEHFERIGDRLEVTPGLPARSTTPAGGAGSAVTGAGGGGAGSGTGGGVVVGGALTAESRNLSSKLSLSSLARSTSKAKFVNAASSASLEPHKDLTALVHRQEEEEHQLGTFNPSFTLSIPNRSVLNLVPSHTSVPREDSAPYVNSYVPGAGGGGEGGAPTNDGGGWPDASNGGWGAPPVVPPPVPVDSQWPGADLSTRGNKSLLEFVGDTLYRKGPPRERWRLGRKLGEGGNSRVYEAVHAVDGTKAAVKIIDKRVLASAQAEKRLWFEVYAFKLLRFSGGHPNIVELLEVGEDDESVYLCMELLVGGELFSRITDQGQYTEKHAAALVEAMLHALSICHQLNITHRDVKPENWVFTDTGPEAVVKLIDFGICFYSEDPNALCRSIIGTPLYVAPEVLLRQPYGPEADMWSLVRWAGGRRGATVVACGGARAGNGVSGVVGGVGAGHGALGSGDANLLCFVARLVPTVTCLSICGCLQIPVFFLAISHVPLVVFSTPFCVVLHRRASLCTSCSLGGHPLTTLTRSSWSRRSSTTRWSLLAATGCSSLRRAKTLSPASSTRTPLSGWRRPRRSTTIGSATTATRRRPTCLTWRRPTSAGTTR